MDFDNQITGLRSFTGRVAATPSDRSNEFSSDFSDSASSKINEELLDELCSEIEAVERKFLQPNSTDNKREMKEDEKVQEIRKKIVEILEKKTC